MSDTTGDEGSHREHERRHARQRRRRRVPAVDDVIAFHGESVAEFVRNFHGAVDGCLEAAGRLDGAPERPAGGEPMPRIAPDAHAAASKAAARSGTRLNERAGRALRLAAKASTP